VTPEGRGEGDRISASRRSCSRSPRTAGDAAPLLHPLSFSCASPEQLRGEPLSFASDVYALGVLLYELVAGVNPQYRDGASFDETFKRVVDLCPSRRAADRRTARAISTRLC
jgi:hypothetical protein